MAWKSASSLFCVIWMLRILPLIVTNIVMEDGGLCGGWAPTVWCFQKLHLSIRSILSFTQMRCLHQFGNMSRMKGMWKVCFEVA